MTKLLGNGTIMLILTRRTNERIFIGDDIVLVVLGVENNRVKLGIEAPADVTILREEIRNNSKNEVNDNKVISDIMSETVNTAKTGTD